MTQEFALNHLVTQVDAVESDLYSETSKYRNQYITVSTVV